MTSPIAMSGAATAPAKTRTFGWKQWLRLLRPSCAIEGYDFVIAFAVAAGMAAAYPLFAG